MADYQIWMAQSEFSPSNAGAEIKLKPGVPYRIVSKSEFNCVISASGRDYILNKDEMNKGSFQTVKEKSQVAQVAKVQNSSVSVDIDAIILQIQNTKHQLSSLIDQISYYSKQEWTLDSEIGKPKYANGEIAKLKSGEKVQILSFYYSENQWNYIVLKFHTLIDFISEDRLK